MIDLNHSNASSRSLSERLSELIDAGLVDDEAGGRTYLGASALGHECSRSIQLDYIRANGLPGAPEPCEGFSGQTLRIFGLGHNIEALAAGWLKLGGFEISTSKPDGGQHGFSTAGGRFRGHVDGVILDGPGLETPAIWEHKGLNAKGWGEVVKKGVQIAYPAYYGQMQLYMAYLELTEHPALFMATNKNTCELYFELVPFDGAAAQRISDKAVSILQSTDAGELMPKAFASGDHFVCRMCKWREFCW